MFRLLEHPVYVSAHANVISWIQKPVYALTSVLRKQTNIEMVSHVPYLGF